MQENWFPKKKCCSREECTNEAVPVSQPKISTLNFQQKAHVSPCSVSMALKATVQNGFFKIRSFVTHSFFQGKVSFECSFT